MSFLTPWFALGLAAAVIPALVLLYFLKLRRRQETVPSTFLWRRAVQDLQVNAPFQRLRKNLLLLLQLLVLGAALFALARPIVQTDYAKDSSLILLVDRSASMNTKEADGQTRFEIAKEQATRLVRSLNKTGSRWWSWIGGQDPMTRVMLIAFAERAVVVSPFTTNTSDLIDMIARIEPTDATTNLRAALELAQAYATPGRGNMDAAGPAGGGSLIQNPINPEESAKIVLFSDGCVGSLDDVSLTAGNMAFIKAGEQTDNVGLTALRIQRNYEKPELLSVFVQVKNFSPAAVTTDVSLYIDGRLGPGRVETVRLAPMRRAASEGAAPSSAPADGAGSAASSPSGGSATALSFEFLQPEAATLEVRLSRDDPFMVDNRAIALVPPPKKLAVLVVTAGNDFLAKVIEKLPLEERRYMTPEQYERAAVDVLEVDGHSKYDVVIFDKHDTKRLPPGNYFFIGGLPEIEALKRTGQAENFAMMWWDETHPILRYVGLDYVYVGKAAVVEMPREAQRLMEGPQGPVLARYWNQGRQFLLLTFGVEHSNLRIKTGFPVMMYNAIRFLGEGGASSEQDIARPGDPILLSVPAGTESATLSRPDARKVSLKPDESQIVRYAATDRVGIYRVEPGIAGRDAAAVNLEDAAESDISPSARFQVGGLEVRPGQAITSATPEIWRWFAGAALVILLLEWYIYNRRVMI